MRLSNMLFLGLATLAASAPAYGSSPALSDAQVKRALIEQSIAGYPGNCPCPYNSARNGSSCGKRSAWSRGGGYAPLCYPADITKDMVSSYRASR